MNYDPESLAKTNIFIIELSSNYLGESSEYLAFLLKKII